MNAEIPIPLILGIVIGLSLAGVASFRAGATPSPYGIRGGGAITVLVYAVLAAPTLVTSGMNVLGLTLLTLLIVGAAVFSAIGQRLPQPPDPLINYAIGALLSAVILISAGQCLALVARVDPRVTVLAVAAAAAVAVAGQGSVGSSRVGAVAVSALILPIGISLALGFKLGGPEQLIPPLVQSPPISVGVVMALAAMVAVLGVADSRLSALRTDQRSGDLIWSAAAAVIVVTAMGLGLLMFLGGVVIAPSLQFFVVPANLDLLPPLALALLTVATLFFVALAATLLAGVTSGRKDAAARRSSSAALWGCGAVGVALALIDPPVEAIVVVATLLASADLGRRLRGAPCNTRSRSVGSIGVCLAALSLTGTGQLTFGWAATCAWSAVALLAFLGTPREPPTPLPSSPGNTTRVVDG
jgi:hypothetical protein